MVANVLAAAHLDESGPVELGPGAHVPARQRAEVELGATIRVTGAPGLGSTFTAVLPTGTGVARRSAEATATIA